MLHRKQRWFGSLLSWQAELVRWLCPEGLVQWLCWEWRPESWLLKAAAVEEEEEEERRQWLLLPGVKDLAEERR